MNAAGKGRVVIFPAMVPPGATGRQAHFLFSVTQVEDVIREAEIYKVPFSPAHVEGLAEWRGRAVPVISLEKCLGLPVESTGRVMRMIMLRTAAEDGSAAGRAMIRTASAVRMTSLPSACKPLTSLEWVPRPSLIRGAYEWPEGFLLVADMRKILKT